MTERSIDVLDEPLEIIRHYHIGTSYDAVSPFSGYFRWRRNHTCEKWLLDNSVMCAVEQPAKWWARMLRTRTLLPAGLRYVQRFERVESVAVFVRIAFGITNHSGLADRVLHGGMAVTANPVVYFTG